MTSASLIQVREPGSVELPRSLRNAIANYNQRVSDVGAGSRLGTLMLALPAEKNWTRPASVRLQSMERELQSVFREAGYDSFVDSNATLYSLWTHQEAVKKALIDYIQVKLGIDLTEHYMGQDIHQRKGLGNLLPRLQSALIYQEVNRKIIQELGIETSSLLPSTRLNSEKGEAHNSALDLTSEQKHDFLHKVAVSFDIDGDRLIHDFERSDYETVSCLWDAVSLQTHGKYGTPDVSKVYERICS
jgi:hypothetical protein